MEMAAAGFFVPGAFNIASRLQYSSGINAEISSSRSQIIRSATDWDTAGTQSAFTFSQRIGLIL